MRFLLMGLFLAPALAGDAVQVVEDRTEAEGRSADTVNETLRDQLSDLKVCGVGAGDVVISFEVDAEGATQHVRVEGGSHPSRTVRQCVADQVDHVAFTSGAEALVRLVVQLG